jgi:pimeloyl-ACP methyl ester carboxylesterase
LAALAALCLYLWPARRNFYGQLRGVEVRLDVPYIAGSTNRKQALDVYLPRARERPFPLVVFVHGGYFSPLDRRWLEPLLGTHGNVGGALARQGIGAVIVGYRQYPEIERGDESLDDIARALRYVLDAAASWGADAKRVVVMGHSAGGHLASLLGMDSRILARNGVASDAIAGFISVDGVFDLKATLAYFEPKEVAILRGLFGPDDGALADHSTLHHLHEQHAPMLFVDSTDDMPVCRDSFHELERRLANDERARFVELPGIGHNEMIVDVGMPGDVLTPLVVNFVADLLDRRRAH